MSADRENFALSFSHGIIKLGDVQYTGISSIKFSQDVERSVTYGTSRKPERKTEGQAKLGEGTVTFSDLSDGIRFLRALSDNPSAKIFAIDATFANEAAGEIASFEMLGCSLAGFEGNFEQGADALPLELPFDFLTLKIDGKEFVL
jgi:hypothetical protein